MTSSRPYLLRAMYEWIVDNGMTPYILVDTRNDQVIIPRQFEEDGKIVLNLGPTAVQSLDLGNEAVSFDARFDGSPMVHVDPVGARVGAAQVSEVGVVPTRDVAPERA